MKRINLQNHTTFSDGKNTPKELIEKAIGKLDVIAITDHYEYFTGQHIFRSDIKAYFQVLAHLKHKYRDKIKILCGFEINLQTCDEADLPLEFVKHIDILLFEHVDSLDDINQLIVLKEQLPMKVGLAHPDFNCFSDHKKLIDLLEKHHIFVELNTSCYKYYSPRDRPDLRRHPLVFETQKQFYRQLRKRTIEISIGADVHGKDEDVAYIAPAVAFLDELRLTDKLIKL